MKQWTVMLIPHGHGGTRSLNLHSLQIWAVVGALVVLSFSSAFLLQKYLTASRVAADLRQTNAELRQARDTEAEYEGVHDDQVAEVERRIREQYELRDRAITQELTQLYEFEDQVREMAGLKPRVRAFTGLPEERAEGGPETPAESEGKGGPPEGPDDRQEAMAIVADDHPPHVIYGLSRPSADLMALEITLRRDSLRDLLLAMRDQAERLARTPSIWPSQEASRHITSRYGWRRDPFTHRGRHHTGLDIGGRRRSPVLATARGEVIFSGYERYFGHVVRIDHGYGIRTVYGHLDKRAVKVGDQVERYDQVGTLGSTGRSTGPHIHYEIIVNGKSVDPEKYLKE